MSEETQVLAAEAVAQEPAVLETEQNQSTEQATEETTQQETETQKAEEEEHKRKGGWQRKIEKQQRLLEEREREIAFLRGKAGLDLEQPGPASTQSSEKPTRDKFQSDEDFVEALADWKVEQKFSAAEQRRKQEEAVAPIKKAVEDFAASVGDYHETMSEATDVPCNDQVAMFLRDPEIGPQLGYFLAKNPDVAENLVKLGPAALAKEISALEPRFLKTSPSAKTATVSKAPPPPTPAGKVSAQSTKDPGEMSPAEYRAWRAKTYPNL